MSRRVAALLVAIALVSASTSGVGAATAEPGAGGATGTRHNGPDYKGGRRLPIAQRPSSPDLFSSRKTAVGDTKRWFAIDDVKEEIYVKPFTLRATGRKIEVWVTPDLAFPSGDCRNDERVQVTDAQVRYLIRQFDGNIYPKESRVFSRPPSRDGRNGRASNFIDAEPRYYRGDGDKIVVLVDNVRDRNFYDLNNAGNTPYIIGFFYSFFNRLTDRNVMTIDGFDWIHRTGDDPPHEPDVDDLCNSKPARPYLIEETFAHEYQHLLEHYEDRNEATWLNEGLSDWAQTLTGYAQPTLTIAERGFDRHIECFLGFCNQLTEFNPNPSEMGPENSLTRWEDQGDDEILADYGAAYTFMELLSTRYGRSFMTSLHRNGYNGLRSLRRILRAATIPATPNEIVAEWAAAMALDAAVDRGATVSGGDAAELRIPTLTGRINWNTPHAYDSPGAPPNGSDYVRLRDKHGGYLSAGDIDTISFSAAPLPPRTRLTVRLIAYDDAGSAAWIAPIPLDAQLQATLTRPQLDAMIGTSAETVAAIVTFHDPSESQTAYARYEITVDKVLQPGG